ncbi:PilZ domain-containing protein [bacterium]
MVKKKTRTKEVVEINFENQRKHRRIRLSPLIIEPVQIRIPDVKGRETVPAIIADLSARGMAMLTYVKIPIGTEIAIDFNLIGLKIGNVKGKITHIRSHYKTFVLVIKFNKLQKVVQNQIEHIAMDYEDCEVQWKRGDKNFCTKACEYYPFCSKSIKKT